MQSHEEGPEEDTVYCIAEVLCGGIRLSAEEQRAVVAGIAHCSAPVTAVDLSGNALTDATLAWVAADMGPNNPRQAVPAALIKTIAPSRVYLPSTTKRNSALTKLNISKTSLSLQGVKILVQLINEVKILDLDISSCDMGDESIRHVVRSLSTPSPRNQRHVAWHLDFWSVRVTIIDF